MKATLALALANAVLAAAGPLQERAYVTQVEVKTVTSYVYPDGTPAQPTPGTTYESEQPSNDSSQPPSSSGDSETEQPSESDSSGGGLPDLGLGGGSGGDAPVDTGDVGSVQEASLNAHNAHRANHTCEDVEWDQDLANYAKQLAQTCSYGHDTKIGGGGYGQNIAMGAESNFDLTEGQSAARAITRQWYNNEFELYPKFGAEADPHTAAFEKWGHISQLLWKSTKKIGCAVELCDGGELAAGMKGYFAVCNYSPPGNMDGAFALNVLPATGGMKILEA